MKILYLVHQFFPEYYTGTEKFVYNTSSMMQKVGHGVRVLTYGFYQDSFFDRSMGDILYREFTYKGVPVTAIRHKFIPDDLNIVLGDKSIARVSEYFLSTEKPDIVHVGHPMRVIEFVKACRFLAIPYLMTLTDFWLLCPKVNLFDSQYNLCAGPEGGRTCKMICTEIPDALMSKRSENVREILFGAKKVVSPSKFLRGLFKKELGDFDITVINHGINFGKIKRNPRHYGKGDKLVFCYAGNIDAHKGVHVLLDAFAMIQSSNVVLKIFGSGQNPSYTQRVFDMAKNDKRVEFCGVYSEENVGDIFSKVDVIVVPSLVYESYSLVLHEGLACHTPVIASNVGSMAEKIVDGFNGYTFRIGDSAHLRTVLETIIRNPGILNELKTNLRGFMIPTIEQEAYTYEREYRKGRVESGMSARIGKESDQKTHLGVAPGTAGPGSDTGLSPRDPGGLPLQTGLEIARGYFERIDYQDHMLNLSGWMLLPNRDFDSFALYIDQRKVEENERIERRDVAEAFPFIPHSKNSGFSFSLHRRLEDAERTVDIRVIGISKGRELAKIEAWYRRDLSSYPVPPSHLIWRVAAHENPSAFLITGMQNYREFWTHVCKYADPCSIKSMLDWGCGCGRILGVFLRLSGIPRICGCDIDAEAIAWCRDNLNPAEFTVIPLFPPTPYPGETFDLIISFSVLSHLTAENQFLWLEEMQRLLTPGGLFLATFHGEFATFFNFLGKKTRDVLKKGICDIHDEHLDNIVPKGYYRGVFQSKEYTLENYSRYFEILEYVERGGANYQDLIVMRKRGQRPSSARTLESGSIHNA